jgi:pimeloyl-ACP methyl ester carboxylesterase
MNTSFVVRLSSRFGRAVRPIVCGIILSAVLTPGIALAQAAAAKPDADKAAADKGTADKVAEKGIKKAPRIPDPRTLKITSKDGLQQMVSYYASLAGKDSVPIILLHDQGGKRDDFKSMAMFLQEGDMAVIVPDLRGHGGSTTLEDPRTKKAVTLNNRSTGRNEITRMVQHDLEAIKSFLMKENNAGKLNIRKLCVLGVGMGTVVAANWAAQDWTWPDVGGQPQGKDVRGLILIAPVAAYKGLTVNKALETRPFKEEISFLILAGGKDPRDKTYESTLQFQRLLAKAQMPKKTVGTPSKTDDEKPVDRLVFKELPTTLQGMKLLESKEKSLKILETIDQWIQQTLVERMIDWEERK